MNWEEWFTCPKAFIFLSGCLVHYESQQLHKLCLPSSSTCFSVKAHTGYSPACKQTTLNRPPRAAATPSPMPHTASSQKPHPVQAPGRNRALQAETSQHTVSNLRGEGSSFLLGCSSNKIHLGDPTHLGLNPWHTLKMRRHGQVGGVFWPAVVGCLCSSQFTM